MVAYQPSLLYMLVTQCKDQIDPVSEEKNSIAGGISSWYNHCGNQSGGSSENWTYYYVRTQLLTFLGIYPKDAPTYNKDTCSTMFMAALFVICRKWKQPR